MKFKLIMSVALSAAALSVSGQTGTCGTGVIWSLEDGTLHISGDGAMNNFENPDNQSTKVPSWSVYKNSIKKVIVDNGVTSVGDFAFYKYDNIESVTLGEGLTHIGNRSFYNCVKLTELSLPESLKTIGDNFVSYSQNGYVFYNCQSLTTVTLPESLEAISLSSFDGCSDLETVNWNAVECYADRLSSAYIFGNSPVRTVNFGPKVKAVPAYGFCNVSSLTNVNTTGNIDYVGVNAFTGTNWLNNQAFNGMLYIDNAAYRYHYAEENIDPLTVEFREGTKGITDYIFENERRLVKVIIPESVDRIGNNSFKGCTSLGEVVWNAKEIEDVENYSGSKLFGESLAKITFGDNVKMLPDYFLYKCSGLISLTLPESLETIGEYAFEGCDALKTLDIPDNVATLGRNAVYSCAKLEKLTIGEGLKEFSYNLFLTGCPNLTVLEWNAVATQEKTFDAYHPYDRCMAPLTTVIFGDKVEYVPGQLFWGMTTLQNVTLGNNVSRIGEGAFRGCTAMTEIKLPESLLTIGDYAFCESGLKSVVIPENVTDLGTWGLGTSALESVISTPWEAPKNTSSFINYQKELKLYVPDVENYKINGWEQYGFMMEPMVVADKYEFAADEDINPALTCNIPGYKMELTSVPAFDSESGKHLAILEGKFTGSEDFTAKFGYRYQVGDNNGVDDAELADIDSPADIYNAQGIRLMHGASAADINELPAGIYIVKTTKSIKKIIK